MCCSFQQASDWGGCNARASTADCRPGPCCVWMLRTLHSGEEGVTEERKFKRRAGDGRYYLLDGWALISCVLLPAVALGLLFLVGYNIPAVALNCPWALISCGLPPAVALGSYFLCAATSCGLGLLFLVCCYQLWPWALISCVLLPAVALNMPGTTFPCHAIIDTN